MAQKILSGENLTVITCGQNESGKTHTMFGHHYAKAETDNDLQTDQYFRNAHSDNRVGLTARFVRELFNQVYQMNPYKQQNYTFYISFFELEHTMNRIVHDLLGEETKLD